MLRILTFLLLLWQLGVAVDLKHVSPTTTALDPVYYTELGSKRVKARYGSYEVPRRNVDDGMLEVTSSIDPPCSNCLVTWMQAQLEFTDGATADAEWGMWMHHVVFVNRAQKDGVCPELRAGARFFASGNERTPVDLTAKGTKKIGYKLGTDDTMAFGGELMNMLDVAQEVVLSVTWEYVPLDTPDFDQATVYWLDIGGCGSSEKPAISESLFSYSSPPVTSGFNGRIAFIAGHLHDGGTRIQLMKNGSPVCESEAVYNISKPSTGEAHISKMTSCSDAGKVAPGDEWAVIAHYDTIDHPPMANNDGGLEPVMGIALAYVVEGSAEPVTRHPSVGFWLVLVLAFACVTTSLTMMGVWMRKRGVNWQFWKSSRNGRPKWQPVALSDDPEADANDVDSDSPLVGLRSGRR